MLRNYLKIAWRSLAKNRTYAFINVTGLALGMGCALLIFALVRYHYQTDWHHRNYDRIYQFTSRFPSPNGEFSTRGVPYPFGKAVRNDHPAIERVAMLEEWYAPLVAVPVTTGLAGYRTSSTRLPLVRAFSVSPLAQQFSWPF